MESTLIFQRTDVLSLCKLVVFIVLSISLSFISHTFCKDSRGFFFIQDLEYQHFITSRNFIWRGKTSSKTQCSILCLENSRCQGFFYVTTTNLCQLQSSTVFTNDDMETTPAADYYAITGSSCMEIKERRPESKSGTFKVKLTHTLYDVYCDMATDGGGWTVFQRRIDGSVNFTRSYQEYEEGFGNIGEGEFWLGDAFVFMDGSKFSTYDQDSRVSGSCAARYRGGWWYVNCHLANPNGLYLNGSNQLYGQGICWNPWRGYYYSLKTMRLMFR